MLEQLDTAIAFTVVMLMLSLMITAVVQMISAVLDLRGRNLAAGLENLLRQIEPSLRDTLPMGRPSRSTSPRSPCGIRRLRIRKREPKLSVRVS